MRYTPKRDKQGHFITVISNRVKLCQFCGKEFTPSVKNFARNKFCSQSCASRGRPSGHTGAVKLNAKYDAIHKWVMARKGKPDTCEHCGKSGLHGNKIHWANIDHKYRRVLSDWIRLCRNCHDEYDKR